MLKNSVFLFIVFFSVLGFADEMPNTIYFVTGDEGRFLWKNYPYSGRTTGELARFFTLQVYDNMTGNGPPDFYKEDLIDAIRGQWSVVFSIQKQIRKLRKKGYNIKFLPQVEVAQLLEILSSPHTLAVFHGGHSYFPEGVDLFDLANEGKGEVFLAVYENGKPSALTDEVLNRAKEKLNRPFKASPKLALFFTGACFAGYCDRQIRQKLGLQESTQFLTTKDSYFTDRPAKGSTHKDLAKSFKKGINQWVASLPDLRCKTALRLF